MSSNREYNLLTFYSDEPHEYPELNFSVYAEELCKIVTRTTNWQQASGMSSNNCSGAFTVGIFGSWGSGKTSLMREIEKQLKSQGGKLQEKSRYKTIWFNPWKYDGREDVRNALIQTILRGIANDEAINKDEEKQRKWMSLARKFGLCAAGISLRLTSAAIQSATNIDTKEVSDQIRQEAKYYLSSDGESFDPYLFVNQFEYGFSEAIKSYVGEQGKLIVFIDDLDRCLPESALTILESIKLYLDQSNCIFFIGIDKRIVEQAVKQRYQYSPSTITGQEYIEKIIRLNFFLPEKSPESVEKILQVGLNATYASDQGRWRLIQIATNSNIRKVKQFVIAFDLLEKIVTSLKLGDSYLPNLSNLLLIQLNYPDFFDALVNNNSLLKKFENIFQEEKEFFQIKARMLEDFDGQAFAHNNNLIRFLMEVKEHTPNFSDPNEITKTLRILSKTGVAG